MIAVILPGVAGAQPAPGGDNVLVYVVLAVLGTPVLSFLLSLTRAKVDKDNVVVTGAGSTVSAMNEAVKGLRGDLKEVRKDLNEARAELDQQDARHKQQLVQIRAEHRQEIATMNAAHRAQMVELRAQRDEAQQMIRRLEARLVAPPADSTDS